MSKYRRLTIAVALACPLILVAEKKPVTIESIMKSPPPEDRGSITWAPEGKRFLYEEKKQLWIFDIASGQKRLIVPLQKLEDAATKTEPAAVFDWTNRRVGERDRQWFQAGDRVLVAAGGDLFIVTVDSGQFVQLIATDIVERDPKLSPDNRFVSFRRGHDLYCLDIASKKTIRLTRDGSATLLNGEMDWVYPEELELTTAHWWSPDSRSIAYLQFDVAREPVFPQVSLLNPRGQLEPERYPKPGDPNAEVRVGIVAAQGGETKWMDFGEPRDHLLARVAWLPNGKAVAVERLNRVQNRLDLMLADTSSGKSRVLLHEEDPYWINVGDALHFFADGQRFIWSSERDGFRHLYLYSIDGKLQRQLTKGEWEVESVAAVDEKGGKVYFISTEQSPLERQLYSVGLDGTEQKRITGTAGTHAISMSPRAIYFVDSWSSLESPPMKIVRSAAGAQVAVFREPDRHDAEEYDILPTTIVPVKADDGTLLYARLIKPAGFEPGRKYPVIVMIYGGPHAQMVKNAWTGASWDQALAHKGFAIWQLDNRGSAGRGHRWESVVYHNLGARELEDQKQGLRYLDSLGFTDSSRIGLYGWSYGGYMTLYSLCNAPGLFRAGVAGAPVTSWRNYDSIYTERYMGLPRDNEDGYQRSAPINKAAGLASKLMIVHNVEDDNVHFQNSVQMADALERADKRYQMMLYPQKSHGVTGPVRKHLLESITAFFEENLK
ncbi:MAG: DPP IV N-terminal domain-containing protein [Bryobacteraceae bacterium]